MARQRAYQLLGALKLQHVMHTQVGRLSGGEKRRVALGLELVTNPTSLLCDEVTSALDSKSCELVLDVLFQYTQQVRAGQIHMRCGLSRHSIVFRA
jgi:putative ABC transport system ATP-binding protein